MENYNYRPTLSVESDNNYQNARNDIFKAKISFDKLNHQQKLNLIKELLGIELSIEGINYILQCINNIGR